MAKHLKHVEESNNYYNQDWSPSNNQAKKKKLKKKTEIFRSKFLNSSNVKDERA